MFLERVPLAIGMIFPQVSAAFDTCQHVMDYAYKWLGQDVSNQVKDKYFNSAEIKEAYRVALAVARGGTIKMLMYNLF